MIHELIVQSRCSEYTVESSEGGGSLSVLRFGRGSVITTRTGDSRHTLPGPLEPTVAWRGLRSDDGTGRVGPRSAVRYPRFPHAGRHRLRSSGSGANGHRLDPQSLHGHPIPVCRLSSRARRPARLRHWSFHRELLICIFGMLSADAAMTCDEIAQDGRPIGLAEVEQIVTDREVRHDLDGNNFGAICSAWHLDVAFVAV